MDTFRLGYACSCLTLDIGASHTTRLANATPERLEALIAENLEELELIVRFNASHGIGLFRISSQLVPFASHPTNTLKWWRTFRRDFERIGQIARVSGQRLSLHPSPAGASLSSARPEVHVAALRELTYATRVLELLEQGPDARVVLHVGGAAPDRSTALDAAHRALEAMPEEVRRRLTIENDDKVWTAREVLPLAREHGLPMLADQLHNAVLPSDPPLSTRELFALSASTWRKLELRPKFHIATQRPGGRKGNHDDFISAADWREIHAALPGPVDLMIEAKQKDLALFALRQAGARDARTAPPHQPLGPVHVGAGEPAM